MKRIVAVFLALVVLVLVAATMLSAHYRTKMMDRQATAIRDAALTERIREAYYAGDIYTVNEEFPNLSVIGDDLLPLTEESYELHKKYHKWLGRWTTRQDSSQYHEITIGTLYDDGLKLCVDGSAVLVEEEDNMLTFMSDQGEDTKVYCLFYVEGKYKNTIYCDCKASLDRHAPIYWIGELGRQWHKSLPGYDDPTKKYREG